MVEVRRARKRVSGMKPIILDGGDCWWWWVFGQSSLVVKYLGVFFLRALDFGRREPERRGGGCFMIHFKKL